MGRGWIPGICAAALVLCFVLNIPVWIVLTGLAFLLLMHKQAFFWIGYFLHGAMSQPKAALWFYNLGWRRGSRPPAPLLDYCALLMNDSQYAQAMTVLKVLRAEECLNVTMDVICRQYFALALEKTGDLPQAIEVMESIRQEYTCLRSDFYGTLAYFYLETEDYESALAVNELARREDGNNAVVYDNAALIAYKTGKREEAKQLFQNALELDSAMVSPKYYLGLIAEEDGDRDAAASYFCEVWHSRITGMNTITRAQAEEKRRIYQKDWGKTDES